MKPSLGFRGAGLIALLGALCISAVEKGCKPRAFIFGLGYVGRSFAKYLLNQGWSVSGTCTSGIKAAEMRREGIDTLVFDDNDHGNSDVSAVRTALRLSTHILSSVPPAQVYASAVPPYGGSLYDSADAVLQLFGDDIINQVSNGLAWAGYLSSTGVYGDRGGAWVSEKDDVVSQLQSHTQAKIIARVQAEKSWLLLYSNHHLPIHVFRLAGIYGPGRNAIETLFKAEGDYWACAPDDKQLISRIHVDDICTVLYSTMFETRPGLVVNVADNLPATRAEVLTFASGLMGLGVPIQPAGDNSGVRLRVRGGSKRVNNSLMHNLLRQAGNQIQYPTYIEGLKEIIKSSR
jgi:nucleoside-diphosphate-sugar epimerase